MMLGKIILTSKTAVIILFLMAALVKVASSSEQPNQFFYITLNLDIVTVEAGESTTVLFGVEPVGDYNETVLLTAEDVSDVLMVEISPSSGTPGFTGSISISVDSAAEGSYTFTLKGTAADGLTHTAKVTVQVPYFKLSVEKKVLVAMNGSQASTKIRVEPVYGYDETVTLSVSRVPSKVSVSLSPKKGTPTFTSTLTLTVYGDTPFETSWITVEATGSDGKIKTVSIEFAVVYVDVEAFKQPMSDLYSRIRVNPDGSYYPGDGFWIRYEVTTRNIGFSRVEFVFNGTIFKGPETMKLETGIAPFDVKKTASAGNFELKVKAVATYVSTSGRIVPVQVTVGVPVKVVKYDPYFTVLFTYLVLKGEGDTSFEKPFAIIVRYDGNGPEHNLEQRAVIEEYAWKGFAFKSLSNEGLNVASELGAVIFYATGLDYSADPYTPILIVDGTHYTYYDLPMIFHWPAGSKHSYEWTESLQCLSEPHASFTFQSCYGLNRTGTLTTPLLGQVMAANYALTKPIERFAQGEEPILNWTNKPKPPLLFNNETRYAKIVMDIDDTVMSRVEALNYTQVGLKVTFYSSEFSLEPTKLFTANYTYLPEDYVQPLLIRAFKLEGDKWITDNSVYMEAVFAPPTNLTVADFYVAWFEAQGVDEEVLKMVEEDLVEAEPQTFNGTGEIFVKLSRYSFLYNLTVMAEGYNNKVEVSRLVIIPFGKTETYPVYVNLAGGGVNITVTRDTGQYAKLRMFAPPEAGGLIRISIYNEAEELLTSEILTSSTSTVQGIFGFAGEREIFLAKTAKTGATLTVEAENVWGATTAITVQVKPYTAPARWVSLNELTYWLFILIAAAIAFNFITFLVKGKKR